MDMTSARMVAVRATDLSTSSATRWACPAGLFTEARLRPAAAPSAKPGSFVSKGILAERADVRGRGAAGILRAHREYTRRALCFLVGWGARSTRGPAVLKFPAARAR